MKCIFCILICQAIAFSCIAQSSSDSLTHALPIVLKFAPLSLIDIHPTYQLAAEYFIKDHWSVQQEAGYGNNAILSQRNPQERDMEVWRFRSEVRFYLYSGRYRDSYLRSDASFSRPYWAFEGFYKRVNFKESEPLGMDCINGQCAYFQRSDYKTLKDVIGYHLKFGYQAILAKRIAIDLYSGFGLRHIFVRYRGAPNGAGVVWNDFRDWITINPTEPGKYRLLSMAFGFKAGYVLYRK